MATYVPEKHRKQRACYDAGIALEERAGIGEEMRRIRDIQPSYLGIYDIEDPAENMAAFEAVNAATGSRKLRKLREVYFSVADLDLRKQLIANQREQHKLTLEFFREEVAEAHRKLAEAQRSGANWWIVASIPGLACIAAGYGLFGIPGALGGALVGLFAGRQTEHNAKRNRDEAVAAAEEILKDAERTVVEVSKQPATFSRSEERTGEADAPRPAEPPRSVA